MSYHKALRVLTDELKLFVETHRIEVALRTALPARQRKRLADKESGWSEEDTYGP